MDGFNVLGSLKLQSYLRNQNLDDNDMSTLESTKFEKLIPYDEYYNIYKKVERYRTLEQEQLFNPTSDNSVEMTELSEDVLYDTGIPINSINLSSIKTNEDIERILGNSNITSKNDLFVNIDYDDYNYKSNVVKCNIVGHDYPNCYGISAGAKIAITKSGKIITTKNSLYVK